MADSVAVHAFEQKVGSTIRYRIRYGKSLFGSEKIVQVDSSSNPTGPTIVTRIEATEVWVYVGDISDQQYRITVTPLTNTSPSQVLKYDFDVTGIL